MGKICFDTAYDSATQKVRIGNYNFEGQNKSFEYVEEGRIFQSKKRYLYVDGVMRINENGIILDVLGRNSDELILIKKFLAFNWMNVKISEDFLIKKFISFPYEEGYQIGFIGKIFYLTLPLAKNTAFAKPLGFFASRNFKKETENLKLIEVKNENLLLALLYYVCMPATGMSQW